MRAMRHPCSFLAALAVLAAFVSCADRQAGGSTGVETTNGVMAILVHDSLDLPAVAARVVARPADWMEGDPLPVDSQLLEELTDSTGRAVFPDLPAGPWRFEMSQGRWAAQFLGKPSSESVTNRIRLQRMGTLRGKVSPFVRVVLVGLRHWASSDSSGSFRIDSLPPGTVDIRTPHDGARGYAGIPAAGTATAPVLRADPAGTTILDDFQDGDSRMRFAPVTGGGWWYVSAAPGMVVTPEGVTAGPYLGVITDSLTKARSFRIDTRRDTAANPWTELGFDLGSSRANFTGLQALTIRARGEGTWSLRIRTLDAAGAVFLWQKSLRLDTAWTSRKIPADSLVYGKLTWDATAVATLSRTTSVSLQSLGEGWIEIDELGIEGPSPDKIWPGVVMP